MKKLNFILDVDGVLSTGQFLYSSDGKAYKIFGPHDADGFRLIQDKLNIRFITADRRGFSISKKRVSDMGFEVDLVSEAQRYDYLKKNFGFKNLIFMGDGIFDAPILKECLFGIAPANARPEAKKAARYVTESKAGEGAICDACLKILKVFLKPSPKK